VATLNFNRRSHIDYLNLLVLAQTAAADKASFGWARRGRRGFAHAGPDSTEFVPPLAPCS
jgi:hypothetical protein